MRILVWTASGTVLIVILLILVGNLLIGRLEPVARAEAPSDPETSFLETRSGRVHVLDIGSGDVLLLLHGTGRSVADWQEGLAERLAQRKRCVVPRFRQPSQLATFLPEEEGHGEEIGPPDGAGPLLAPTARSV